MSTKKTTSGSYIEALLRQLKKKNTEVENKKTELEEEKKKVLKLSNEAKGKDLVVENETIAIYYRIKLAHRKDIYKTEALTDIQFNELKGYYENKEWEKYYMKEKEYKVKEILEKEVEFDGNEEDIGK